MKKVSVKKPKIIVIVGPTASGKSALAVSLAKKYDGEVISADSRQVYRGLDIGTGKITKEEMQGIPHHLLDVASPRKQFSASDFVLQGRKAIDAILAKGRLPIITGGTGFYIAALIGEVSLSDVTPNPKLRAELELYSTAELVKKLEKCDPRFANIVDRNNRVRLIRAIEISSALGKVPPKNKKALYETLKLGILIERSQLEGKIQKRLTDRIHDGLVNEGKSLHAKGLSYKRMEELGLEYRYLARLLKKKLTEQQFEEQLALKIFQYAKRQMTWFSRDKEIHWVKSLKEAEKLTTTFCGSSRT